ncbi:MAG: polymerase subunit sigma-70 [Clostridiales bacterium]|jgi:RNA polymerase sigma-70 factor (ECF subfamily)|nr:polymerase subunit sigma-70 [Clostridiales bacterium]
MSDEFMIKSIIGQKEEGLKMLIDKYSGLLIAVVRRNLGTLSRYEEECVDDVLFSIWTHIESFDPSKNTFKNWICAIAKYKAIDYLRKYKRDFLVVDIETTEMLTEDSGLIECEIQEAIDELLSGLKPEDKEIFIKHYIEQKNVIDISNEMGISTDSIYSRLSRGRKKLRKDRAKNMDRRHDDYEQIRNVK